MSGVEFIVGAVLGGIPLVIEAYDHFEGAAALLQSIRQYSQIVKRLDTKIQNQKLRFRLNVYTLLVAMTRDQDAIEKLLSHPVALSDWRGLALHSCCLEVTESVQLLLRRCKDTLGELEGCLKRLERSINAFKLTSASDNSTISSALEKMKRLSQKFKFSHSRPEIEKTLEDLRGFNDDFEWISGKIVESVRSSNQRTPEPPARQQRTDKESTVEEYRKIQHASQSLYHMFEDQWSCLTHSSHVVYLGHNQSHGKGKPRDEVCFSVAVLHDGESPRGPPLWLDIQQSSGQGHQVRGRAAKQQISEPAGVISALESTMKATFTARQEVGASSRGDTATISADTTKSTPNSIQTRMMVVDSPDPIDLGCMRDVCLYLGQGCSGRPVDSCLGYLNARSRQLFYPSSTNLGDSGEISSLRDLIVWVNEDANTRGISIRPRVKIKFAAMLASLLLEFYSTPWLPVSLQSQDIWLFGLVNYIGLGDTLSRTTPYLKVDITKPQSVGQAPSQASVTIQEVVGARNQLLFRFGVILLELVFAKPWSELIAAASVGLVLGRRMPDLEAADRLARKAGILMGPAFSRVVRQCLGCDFGLGENDLSNEELQGRFIMDVVFALSALA